jgi:hypothetical protein
MNVDVHHSQIHLSRKTDILKDMISLQREYVGVYSIRHNKRLSIRFYKKRDRFQNFMGLRVGTLKEEKMSASVLMDIDRIDDLIVTGRVVKQSGITCYELSNECMMVRSRDRHADTGMPPLTIFIMGQFWGFFFSHCFDFLFHLVVK